MPELREISYHISQWNAAQLIPRLDEIRGSISRGAPIELTGDAPWSAPNEFQRPLDEGATMRVEKGAVLWVGLVAQQYIFHGMKSIRVVDIGPDTPADPFPSRMIVGYEVEPQQQQGPGSVNFNFLGPTLVGDVSLQAQTTVAPTFQTETTLAPQFNTQLDANVNQDVAVTASQSVAGEFATAPPIDTPSQPIAPQPQAPTYRPRSKVHALGLSLLPPKGKNLFGLLVDIFDEPAKAPPPHIPPPQPIAPLQLPPQLPGPPPVVPPTPVDPILPPEPITAEPKPLQLPIRGRLHVTLEVATAALRSEVWLLEPAPAAELFHDNRKDVGAKITRTLPAGAVPVFEIRVFGESWGIGTRRYRSDHPYNAKVTQISATQWRVSWEDLPEGDPRNDQDFDDVVIHVTLEEVVEGMEVL